MTAAAREPASGLEELHAVALELADIADAISLEIFGGQLPAREKADGSPVTAADTAIERAVREHLAHRRPHDAVLGEEEGGAVEPDVPTWLVDPIDGTKNFMRGIPVFATLIGVLVGGRVVVGVASVPALQERWDAMRGGGTRRNGTPVHVSGIGALAESHVLHGGLDWFRNAPGGWDLLGRVADRAWRTRGFGDFWMHLMVAAGQAEVAFERDLKAWDIAALICIVEEAGGRVTSWDGRDIFGPGGVPAGDVVTSNGVVHDELLALLATAG